MSTGGALGGGVVVLGVLDGVVAPDGVVLPDGVVVPDGVVGAAGVVEPDGVDDVDGVVLPGVVGAGEPPTDEAGPEPPEADGLPEALGCDDVDPVEPEPESEPEPAPDEPELVVPDVLDPEAVVPDVLVVPPAGAAAIGTAAPLAPSSFQTSLPLANP